MSYARPFRIVSAIFVLFLGTAFAQNPQGYRPQPIAPQCQSALTDRVSSDAKRRVSLSFDTQNPYSPGGYKQGLRGRLRYGVGGPNSWRTANYDCVVDTRRNRVESASYTPRANGNGWPGGPGGPGPGPGPGGPGWGGPGSNNYPRVRVDTAGRGSFNTRSFRNVTITRGYLDSKSSRPSVALRGGNFMIRFYGIVQSSDGYSFNMRITGSDRGNAQGTIQARLNRDRNEVESINVSGTMGRDNFTGNFGR